jgi:protein phosphatase
LPAAHVVAPEGASIAGDNSLNHGVLNLREGLRVEVASLSDVGCVRANNEDYLGVFPGQDSRGHLLIVADGMGGAAAGEVASRLAVETVSREFLGADHAGNPHEVLDASIKTANRVVFQHAGENEDHRGMGTTCTTLVLSADGILIGHVGDSRAYMVVKGVLNPLTEDHTLAAELERHRHPGMSAIPRDAHNILTRCLGVEANVTPVISSTPLPEAGSVLVMCSDGLTGMVDDPLITQVAYANEPEEACRRLVELAKEEGGIDNITVIVARFTDA